MRAIDALLTCGRGQRIGLFGGSGVGKSTLLGMMARGTAADVAVIALVGERGREVRSFLEHDLGPEGLKRAVVVVSTSDNPPLVRLRAAYAATSDRRVLPRPGQARAADDGLGDALRDGAARGRPRRRRAADGEGLSAVGVRAAAGAARARRQPARAAAASPAFYTVLVEGDDHNEPVADARARHPRRPHRAVARARRPQSLSGDRRPAERQPDDARRDARRAPAARPAQVRDWMAAIAETEDLVSVGAYVAGSNPRIDEALAKRGQIEAFLKQPADVACSLDESIAALRDLRQLSALSCQLPAFS